MPGAPGRHCRAILRNAPMNMFRGGSRAPTYLQGSADMGETGDTYFLQQIQNIEDYMHTESIRNT